MTKTKITHEECKNIIQEQISKMYKKIGFKTLTEIDQYMEQYEIIPFEPNTGNTDIDKLINILCDELSIEEENLICYKGFMMGSDSYKFYSYFQKHIELISIDGGSFYSNAFYNQEYRLILSWCEGDVWITVCKGNDSFNKELNKTIKFYKEEI